MHARTKGLSAQLLGSSVHDIARLSCEVDIRATGPEEVGVSREGSGVTRVYRSGCRAQNGRKTGETGDR